jgi:hypothetical protein
MFFVMLSVSKSDANDRSVDLVVVVPDLSANSSHLKLHEREEIPHASGGETEVGNFPR